MPRSYGTKNARRFYTDRSQRIAAKRKRRAGRIALMTPTQEANRAKYLVKILERGMANCRPKEANNEPQKQAA